MNARLIVVPKSFLNITTHSCIYCFLSAWYSNQYNVVSNGFCPEIVFHLLGQIWPVCVYTLKRSTKQFPNRCSYSPVKFFHCSQVFETLNTQHLDDSWPPPDVMPSCNYRLSLSCVLGFPGGLDGKASVCNAGDLGSIPGLGRSPEKKMAAHSSTLAWKNPWMEEPRRLQSMVLQKVGLNWVTSLSLSPVFWGYCQVNSE